METYEGLILAKPDLDQEKIDLLTKKVKDIITENNGNVKESKLWKKTDLAYEVEKHQKGIYLLLIFAIEPKFIKKLNKFFKLDEDILRVLILKKK